MLENGDVPNNDSNELELPQELSACCTRRDLMLIIIRRAMPEDLFGCSTRLQTLGQILLALEHNTNDVTLYWML